MNEPKMIVVRGKPAPQGSKTYMGRGKMVESCKRVKPWRKDIKITAKRLRPTLWHATIGVQLEVEFLFKRPKHHFRTNGELKPKAPFHCTTRVGDIDKLSRAVADALTGVIYEDDSQIISLQATKRYATTSEREGVNIKLTVPRAN